MTESSFVAPLEARGPDDPRDAWPQHLPVIPEDQALIEWVAGALGVGPAPGDLEWEAGDAALGWTDLGLIVGDPRGQLVVYLREPEGHAITALSIELDRHDARRVIAALRAWLAAS